MSKKYLKKEVVTITRTEEISFVDETENDQQNQVIRALERVWRLAKKYVFSSKSKGEEDG